jgi:hypothetical protein
VLRCRSKLSQGWCIRYANAANETPNGNVLQCKFNKPREGKLGRFSYLESLKKHKRRLQWGTFFEDSLVGSKKGKLAPIRRRFKTILTRVTRTRSLDHFFIFKESEKSLTMDSVRNILLDQFNECERIRSLDDLFNFRDSEKSLTMDFVGVSFS